MRCLLFALLITSAVQLRAQEVLYATDDDLRAATQVYAEAAAVEVKRQWLLLRSQKQDVEFTGSLVMSVQVAADGKAKATKVIKQDGDIARLQQLTLQAVEQAQLKPVPQMLVKGLAVRQMPMPSFQVSVPFEGGGADHAGVEAVDSTPKGQYIRKVTQAVEKKWHLYRALGRESVLPSSLLVRFYVNKEGKVEDFKRVEDKESNDWLNNITARAIRDAEIPTMPPEVFEMLPAVDKQRLKIEYHVLIY